MHTNKSPAFGCFSWETGEAFTKSSFHTQDSRYDPLVNVVLLALERAFANRQCPSLQSSNTAVISITDTGCRAHIKRVTDALNKMSPRQAFFARSSAVMLSYYTSLAILSHGPCISLSGGKAAITLGIKFGKRLLRSGDCQRVIFVCADQEEYSLLSSVAAFHSEHLHVMDDLAKFCADQVCEQPYSVNVMRSYFLGESK